MKFQVVLKLAVKEKTETGDVNYIEAGEIVRCVEASTKEEARETFQQIKNDVIENMIRFYLHQESGQAAVILSRNGEWEGFRKPKGTTRLWPKKVILIAEGEEGFDDQRWISDKGGND